MKEVEKLRELYIVKNCFNSIESKRLKELDKNKWEHYININTDFVWYEDTEKGKNILKNIDSIPNDFRDSFLSLFNHTSCFYNYNNSTC